MKEEAKRPQDIISAVNDEVEENLVDDAGENRDSAEEQNTLEASILGSGMGAEDQGYADFKLPDGINVDKNILAIATEQFKELGLNQKQAQGIIDLSPKVSEAVRNAQQQEWDTTTASWAREVRNDPEIGKNNFKKSLTRSERVLRRFDPEGKLREFLVTTKAGNNPDMIRFLVNIDKAVAESSLGSMPAGARNRELSDAELFFPEQAKKDALARKMQNRGL